jgi:SpoIVB peptidase S55
MSRSSVRRSFRTTRTSALALALAASFLIAAPTARAATTPCTDPPAVFPEANLHEGLVGTGWTAVHGRDPVRFQVEVLGVLQDGIAPGLDFILIQVSGSVIDDTGGIAAGFSGSPVYINGKLAGAVSYGFYASDHTIGGMTPAQAMVDILGYPTGSSSSRVNGRQTVRLSDDLRDTAARAAGVARTAFPGEAQKLAMPLGVSGVAAADLDEIQTRAQRQGMSVIPYIAGSASVPGEEPLSSQPIEPGEPFSAVLSYGDITYAGTGTATIVCGDLAVAFGHEFQLAGRGVSAGVNAADVLAVIDDPSGIYGPWKLAQVAEPVGLVDQDRQAGIRGVEGRTPRLAVPIRTDFKNLDTGRRLPGETVVVAHGGWVRWIAWEHVYYNLRSILESYSGTVRFTWTIAGNADGEPFLVSHSNVYSGGGVRYQVANEVYEALRELQRQKFASVRLDEVRVTGAVTEDIIAASTHNARTNSSVMPNFEVRDRLAVTKGDTIGVRVPIVPSNGDPAVTAEVSLDLPGGVTGDGRLTIEAAPMRRNFRNARSFADLLKMLATLGHTTDLQVSLRMEGMDSTLRVTLPQDYVLRHREDRINVRLV